MNYYDPAISLFQKHYANSFSDASIHYLDAENKNKRQICISSPDIKPGNEPKMYLHPTQANHTIILSHGLSDSPYYMHAIADAFFNTGTNVILPLIPGHGLKDPDKAMEDFELDTKWRLEIDVICDVASKMTSVISLGGFSSGGALSYNKVLREPGIINGGLFLFAASIDVRLIKQLGQSKFIERITMLTDGKVVGYGMDPYKYPKMPLFAAMELGQIINQNRELEKDNKITQPVFAAHSINDITAKLDAIELLLKEHAHNGILFTMSNGMAHAELPLKDDITLDKTYSIGKPAYANPDFDLMIRSCIDFYRKYVLRADIT
ncbi:alpha/beta hydrolase [Saprospiraceae bacterium]|nr:alpha/beta hydrolase [Saprospiraceae bacterium]